MKLLELLHLSKFHFAPLIHPIAIAIIFIPLFVFLVVRIVRNDRKKHDSTKITWLRRIIICVCMFFTLLGPSLADTTVTYAHSKFDYLFVIDRTSSMFAVDGDITHNKRLDVAKNDMQNLAKMLPPGKFSAISFDSTAREDLPLTQDELAFTNWAQSLTPEISQFSNGTNFNEIQSALDQTLSNIYRYNPKDKVYLFILSDGENNSGLDVESFSHFDDQIFGGGIIGYGTQQGANIEQYYPTISEQTGKIENASAGSFILTPTGEMAVSTYNEDLLKNLSHQIRIPYYHRTSGDVISDIAKSIHSFYYNQDQITQNIVTDNYIVYPLSIIIAILLIWELFSFLLFNSMHLNIKGKKDV